MRVLNNLSIVVPLFKGTLPSKLKCPLMGVHVSFHWRDIGMYFGKIIHEMVSSEDRCPLMRGVVKDRGHCTVKVLYMKK